MIAVMPSILIRCSNPCRQICLCRSINLRASGRLSVASDTSSQVSGGDLGGAILLKAVTTQFTSKLHTALTTNT